ETQACDGPWSDARAAALRCVGHEPARRKRTLASRRKPGCEASIDGRRRDVQSRPAQRGAHLVGTSVEWGRRRRRAALLLCGAPPRRTLRDGGWTFPPEIQLLRDERAVDQDHAGRRPGAGSRGSDVPLSYGRPRAPRTCSKTLPPPPCARPKPKPWPASGSASRPRPAPSRASTTTTST